MNILGVSSFQKFNCVQKHNNYNSYPNLSPLKSDTVSFGASKVSLDDAKIDMDCITDQRVKNAVLELFDDKRISRQKFSLILKYFGYSESNEPAMGKIIYRRDSYTSPATMFKIDDKKDIGDAARCRLKAALLRVDTTNYELNSYKGVLSENDLATFEQLTSSFNPELDTNQYRKNKEQKIKKTEQDLAQLEEKRQKNAIADRSKVDGIQYTLDKQAEVTQIAETKKIEEELDYKKSVFSELKKEVSSALSKVRSFWAHCEKQEKYINEITDKYAEDGDVQKLKEDALFATKELKSKIIPMRKDALDFERSSSKLQFESSSVSDLEKFFENILKFNESIDLLFNKEKDELSSVVEQLEQKILELEIKEQDDSNIKTNSTAGENPVAQKIVEQKNPVKPSNVRPVEKNPAVQNVPTSINNDVKTTTEKLVSRVVVNAIPFSIEGPKRDLLLRLNATLNSSDVDILNGVDMDAFKSVTTTKIKNFLKSSDYKQILRATIFAYLDVFYKQSNYSNNGVYKLSLSDVISQSEKITSPGLLQEIESIYKKYSKPLDQQQITELKNFLFAYCENLSTQDEEKVVEMLNNYTQYLAGLLDVEKCDEAKETLLKLFWNEFDEQNGTFYSQGAVKKYHDSIIHQDKLKEISDFSDINLEIDIF